MDERRQERKVVTVLFCDLVGFTQRADEMDPEDVASLLEPYHARVKQELERHGGTVEKFIGDAVMALFGAPVAHEDDPERAVRAALAIREFAEDEGVELRIGITTGEALVTLGARPEQGETMATGDVVNTAARIQAAAPVNGILVSERTNDATRDSIDYSSLDPVTAKGKARPIPVWEALDVTSAEGANAETPFVGREGDLRLLEDTLARVEREQYCQLVTLVGVPGIGKSRLLHELAKRRDDVIWRHGRCLPYGDGITFWALGEIVKAHAGILESDPVDVAEGKLRRAIPDDDWVRESVRPLVGLSVEATDEGDRREEAFVAWRRFLEEIAHERALVLLLEDLHWADDGLLDFVDHLVDWAAGVPMLVVCTARPELLERRPGWGGGKTNALTVSLSPLSDEETARLISKLIERAVMPAEAQVALLARAGGNPLYTEQYVRMVVERTVAELTVPETVQGIIAARLDLLEPKHKAQLQDAAVVGKTFWLGSITAIGGADAPDAERGLHVLERKGFVRREREASIEGDTEYAFLHLLVQEVAYGQLPRAQRAGKHRLAAEWIESLGRPEDHAEMLAYHYGEALELGHAAGIDISSFQGAARAALRIAGDRAMALNSYPQALRLYERALELATVTPDADGAQLQLRRARAHFLAVDTATVELLEGAREALLACGDEGSAAEAEILEARVLDTEGFRGRALDLARTAVTRLQDAPSGSAKAYVLANSSRLFVVTGLVDEALEVAREALALSEELGLEELRANALSTIGLARLGKGDFGGLDDLEDTQRVTLEHGSPDEILRGYNNLAWSYALAGRWTRASESWAAQLAAARELGLRETWAKESLILDGYIGGRWHEAVRYAEELLAPESPSVVTLPLVYDVRGLIRLARGESDGAAEDFTEVRSWAQSHEDSSWVASISIDLARAALELGRRTEAVELVGQALAGRHEVFARIEDIALVELAWLLVELDLPRDPVFEMARDWPWHPWHQVANLIANGEFAAAADRFAAFGTPLFEAYARLRAADRLISDGRRAEANAHLHKALAFYRSVGAIRYVGEGEALLAATA
jgi:class 3 adenylate cyclase/tetratricopeptide (TPR) repeat protein